MTGRALSRSLQISPSTLRRWLGGAKRDPAKAAQAAERMADIKEAVFRAHKREGRPLKGLTAQDFEPPKPKVKRAELPQVPRASHRDYVGALTTGSFNDLTLPKKTRLSPLMALSIVESLSKAVRPRRNWRYQIVIQGKAPEAGGFAEKRNERIGSGTFVPTTRAAGKRRKLQFKTASKPVGSRDEALAMLASMLEAAAEFDGVEITSAHVVESRTERREVKGRRR